MIHCAVSTPPPVESEPPVAAPADVPIDTPDAVMPGDSGSAFDAYRAAPAPETLDKVVRTLDPVIGYHLAVRNLGQSPQLRARARVIAANAVRTYDPASGAKLASWVGTQMQRLNRMGRMSGSGLKVPDRIYTDAQSLRAAEAGFLAEHDRVPDLLELSDAARMPAARVTAVRRSLRRSVPSMTFGDTLPSGLTEDEDPDVDEAVAYVYQDSDKIDRKILEMKTGYGGAYEGGSDSTQIAKHLNIDPSQVSRRLNKITLRILKQQDELQQAYGGTPQ